MRILARQKDTNLSQNYLLETDSSVSGCIVTVRDTDKDSTILGQFISKRKSVGDSKPVEKVVVYDNKALEVIDYFNKKAA